MKTFQIKNSNSWYINPLIKTERELNYLNLIQDIFKVKNAAQEWIPYELTPHQVEWHLGDVALLGEKARNRIVVKSRNTSFTTSSMVSALMAVPQFPNQIVPFVKMNEDRANDLINDAKSYIKNMTPAKLENGMYYPFNPADVDMKRIGSIRFPNGVEFRAFPATASASEVIRGLRIAGFAGLIDEANFMKGFENIYIALRDAASGAVDGHKTFQLTVGTTLKGRGTPFYIWFNKIKNLGLFDIYYWPVFNPDEVRFDMPITEQNILPITHWHTLKDLEEKRLEDINKFKEEYMGEVVSGEEQFYPDEDVFACIDTELKNSMMPDHEAQYFIGIDVASVNDYFAVAIFEKQGDIYVQRHLYYTRHDVDLTEMTKHVQRLIEVWKPIRCRIDANGIGFQMGQALQAMFGAIVQPIRGSKIKGLVKNQKIAMGEYQHTNQKALLVRRKLKLINDELQITHYAMWNYKYKAESTKESGHGDIAIANALALLPINFKARKSEVPLLVNNHGDLPENIEQEEVEIEW